MPTCPRCGYDLSGHTATWETVCPLEGQCSECGLEFSWWEVLVDRERFNRRHVEHCERRAIPIAAVRSLLWCVLPWVFWKRMKLRHVPRVGRMVLWLGLVVIGGQLGAAIPVTAALWRVDLHHAERWNRMMQVQLADYRRRLAELERLQNIDMLYRSGEEELAIVQPWVAAPPPPLSVSPSLQQFAKALGYPVVYIEDRGSLASLAKGVGFWPQPLGPYNADWDMDVVRFWRHPTLVVGAIFSIGYLVMLILLPATRRRLKIQTGHLARAGLFGLSWLVLPALQRIIASTAYVIDDLSDGNANLDRYLAWAGGEAWPVWTWIVGAWISIWWLCAIWRGLRFPNPVFHWLMLTIPVVILSIAVLAFVLGPLEINALIDFGDLMSADDGFGFDPENLARGLVDRVP